MLLTGGLLMVLAIVRQAQLSAFIARPVLRGFALALAVAVVAAASAAALRHWPKVPTSMVVIVLVIVAAHLLNLKSFGVEEIGSVQRPAFRLGLPELPFKEWLRAGEPAFGLVVLVFPESWRSLALAHGDSLDANRELMVLGGGNVAAALNGPGQAIDDRLVVDDIGRVRFQNRTRRERSRSLPRAGWKRLGIRATGILGFFTPKDRDGTGKEEARRQENHFCETSQKDGKWQKAPQVRRHPAPEGGDSDFDASGVLTIWASRARRAKPLRLGRSRAA